jgi:hypothetical protein
MNVEREPPMWTVSAIETRKVRMNFTSSGQGRPVMTELLLDGTIIANAIELTDWTEGPVQIEVCGSCGYVHCASGGWVSVKRLGKGIMILPAFDAMAKNSAEYSPPEWMARSGPALISEILAESLRIAAPGLPEISRLMPVTQTDAVLMIQWSAPFGVLGRFPETPSIVLGKVSGVSKRPISEITRELDALLRKTLSNQPVVIRLRESSEQDFSLFLEPPDFPEWSPVVEGKDQRMRLRWGSYVIES